MRGRVAQAVRQSRGPLAVVAACFLVSTLVGWTALAARLNASAYDWLFNLHALTGPARGSVILAIDDETLARNGGMRHVRRTLAGGLRALAAAQPAVVAIDLILAEESDPEEDRLLTEALASTPGLILSCDLVGQPPRWQNPLPHLARSAVAVGHVHANPDDEDSVNRDIPLEKVAGHERRWALALEAFRVARHEAAIEETPEALRVGGVVIPAARANGRLLRVRYLTPPAAGQPAIPEVSLQALADDASRAAPLTGKVVFVGVTAQSAARDRLMTPVSAGRGMVGVEVHAHLWETLARGTFLRDVPDAFTLLISLALSLGLGLAFAWRPGKTAYAAAALLLLLAHGLPHLFFLRGWVLPYGSPVLSAWFSLAGVATYQYFAVRRQWHRSESEKVRYRQAIHLVTHEMRTPLTAIQGSSELMSRYNLNDEKRKQIAQMIHAESQRLARMIQTFLDVERLTAGQMELKREPFGAAELLSSCLERVEHLAERKRIALASGTLDDAVLLGDRELMEYAVYNLLTNAIKYSPADTTVTLTSQLAGQHVRFSVQDQGMGMDAQELKQIFRKFYRTKRAEASGEVGTGIGLSIVEQIVVQHGGKMEVSSTPGKGSCFTMVIPKSAVAATAV